MNSKLKVIGKTASWKTDVEHHPAPLDHVPSEKDTTPITPATINRMAAEAALADKKGPSSAPANFPKTKPFPEIKGSKKTAPWGGDPFDSKFINQDDPIENALDEYQASQASQTATTKDSKVGKGKKKFAQAPAYDTALHDTGDWGGYSYSKGGGVACYHSHPPLKFKGLDGKEYTIYGGNCRTPIVKDADIYIGFDGSVAAGSDKFPWDDGFTQPVLVDYYITDMSAPKNPGSFHKLIDWTEAQLKAGKKIHAGCIGGHGRTGTFLAALVAQMAGIQDSIGYVRKNYCEKAVESKGQIAFLIKEFGCATAKANKEWASTAPTYGKANGYQGSSGGKATPVAFKDAKRKIAPVQSAKNIW